jgi:exodeoxyribonuclease VII large subunit
MGTESGGDEHVGAVDDIATLSAELDTDSLTFVNSLNTEIADLVENTPTLEYEYILGDVSDYGTSSNGHGHFDLVHEDSTLHCVVFRSRLNRLQNEIEDGTLAAVKGDISYYESEGSVSLIVRDVVEVGQGTYQQTYRQNKQTLAKDGYLDEDGKQALPSFPQRVGIATSGDSDAREDAVTSIHDRYPDIDIVIQDTSVQGDNALISMMDAISTLDDDARVDLIVLTRGGGAEKHLRVFNETPLCRVIHETKTPIVVGVGHENDRTLAGEVADRRVMTPTEVGEVVPRRKKVEQDVEQLSTSLSRAYTQVVEETLETRKERLERVYTQHVTDELASLSNRLDHAYEKLEQEKTHEREKAEAVESYQHTTRRQRIIILALLILLGAALALLLITL